MRILAISILLANIVATGSFCTIEEALDTPWRLTESTESCLSLTQVFLEKYQRCSETIHKHISELEFRITVDYNEELVDRKNAFLEIYLQYELYTYSVIKELSEECSNELHGDLKRKLSIAGQGFVVEGKKDFNRLQRLSDQLAKLYSHSKVCLTESESAGERCLTVEPGLETLVWYSRDEPELREAWYSFRNQVVPLMKPAFLESAHISNKWAQKNGYPNDAASWVESFEMSPEEYWRLLEKIHRDTSPLFTKLHAYLRHKLVRFYGEEIVNPELEIPSHLVGNYWSQTWSKTMDIVDPFPDSGQKEGLEITSGLHSRFGNDTMAMFRSCTDYYESIGFDPLPDSIWKRSSLLNPPAGSDIQKDCHGTAWDLSGGDVRISMCGEVGQSSYVTFIHELGHVQYYRAANHLPFLFRDGANEAFHEAIGDTITLLAMSTPRLFSEKFIDEDADIHEVSIRRLMDIALYKLPLIPFAMNIDKWRTEFLAGNIAEDELNSYWWTLVREYQGLTTPEYENRGDEYFDIASKYHVALGIPNYTRYALSNVLQFQFLKAICDEAQPGVSYHECDVSANPDATLKFREMLAMGSSVHWSKALFHITGETEFSGSAMLQYLEPLERWLDQFIAQNDVILGWPSQKL